MSSLRLWGKDNGRNGACVSCGQKTWIESGCVPLCMRCGSEDWKETDQEDPREQTLADVDRSDGDYAWNLRRETR